MFLLLSATVVARVLAGDPGATPPTRGPQRGRCRAPHL